MNWLLVVVAIILTGSALVGRRVGFIKTVFSLFSLIVAIFVTIWIHPFVSDFMRNNEKLNEYIAQKVEKVLLVEADDKEPTLNEEVSYIEKLPLPQSIRDTLIQNNNKEVYKTLATDTFKDYLSSYLTRIIINGLSFVGTFFAILVILWAACFALNIISKLPILNQVNKSAGLLAGLVHGLAIVWVFFIVITVFGGTDIGRDALRMIEENQVLSFIYDNNLLLGFVTGAVKILF